MARRTACADETRTTDARAASARRERTRTRVAHRPSRRGSSVSALRGRGGTGVYYCDSENTSHLFNFFACTETQSTYLTRRGCTGLGVWVNGTCRSGEAVFVFAAVRVSVLLSSGARVTWAWVAPPIEFCVPTAPAIYIGYLAPSITQSIDFVGFVRRDE